MTDRELRVSKIENGTVIDHITGGQALNVLAVLGIDGSAGAAVSVVINVPSDRLRQKDVVKLEDRELSDAELDVLSLIAPEATINIIREYDVIEKKRVKRPERVVGVLACRSRECITNTDEPVEATFDVLPEGVRCEYCGTIIRDHLADHLAI